MKQVHFGKHLRYLVPSELESALLGAAFYTKLASGWSSRAKKFGVLIDLSKVEWVDLGSALQLVLIVESAAREGIRVDLALPYSRARQSEKLWMEKTNVPGAVDNTLRRIERRTAARNFLQYI